MQYLAHTRKACGPLALALVLSACGEETTNASAAAAQNDQSTLTSLLTREGYERPAARQSSPTQTSVNQQFSMPSASAPANPDTNELADGSTIIAARDPNMKPAPGAPITSRPARPVGDTLPVQPREPQPEPGPGQQTPDPVQEPATGSDPLVTLIAKSSRSHNSTGTLLEWSTENVESCDTSGAWDGSVATSGVVHLNHDASGEHTYMISCQGIHGTAMAMVTVIVESTSLAWEAPSLNTDGTQLTDLAGYNLYYGTESGRYTAVKPVRSASQTELDLAVEPGTYYLAMTAYDTTGNESALSNEIIRIIN